MKLLGFFFLFISCSHLPIGCNLFVINDKTNNVSYIEANELINMSGAIWYVPSDYFYAKKDNVIYKLMKMDYDKYLKCNEGL